MKTDAPPRPRWQPFLVVVAPAAVLAAAGAENLSWYGLALAPALALAVAHAAALALALRWPLLGWAVSLGVGALTAALVHPVQVEGAPWPWTTHGMFIHLGVLVMVALRLRLRTTLTVWAVTVVLTALGAFGTASSFRMDVVLMAGLSAILIVAAVAERGRADARHALAHQERLIEAERAKRTLLEERARIARELHDVVAHHMSVIAIQAEAARYRTGDQVEALTRSHALIRQNAVDALHELRRVLGLLRAAGPDARGDDAEGPQPTLAGLDELTGNVRAAGLDVEVSTTGEVRDLPAGVELSAFRIVQEALSNALRHAPGASVRVELAYQADGIHLRIVNGAPTHPAPASSGSGHGVLGMRERVAMLGGTFASAATPDGGYEVCAHLPGQPDLQTREPA